MRAKRKALENPTPIIVEADMSIENTDLADWTMDDPEVTQPSPQTNIKQEDKQSRSPEKPPASAPILPESVDLSKENILVAPEISTGNGQGPTPPSSVSSKPIGLGISTESSNTETAPTTQEQDSAIEALFDTGDSDLVNFDGMDFMTQSNDHSQPQNDEFDLANFGSTSQDFSMTDLHTSAQASNTNNSVMNKQEEDDIFSMVNTQSGDNMDLDFDLGAVDTEFNDMFDAGNELDHDLDSTFFES